MTVVLVAAAALALLVIAGDLLWWRLRPPRRRPESIRRRVRAQLEKRDYGVIAALRRRLRRGRRAE